MMKIQNSARYSREALSKVENAMKKEFLYEEEEPEESVVKSEPAIKVETGKGKKTDSPKDFEEHSFKEINTGSSEIEEVIENPAVRVQTNKDHNIDSLNKDEIPEDEMLMKEMMHKKQFEWVEKMFAMTEEELTWDGFYMLIATVISKNMLLHQTKDGSTLLHMELNNQCRPDFLKCLLGVCPPHLREVCRNDGHTPLHVAVSLGHVECIKMLLENSSPTYREANDNNEMLTPLHLAAIHGSPESMKVLLHGTPLKYREMTLKDGRTALFIAGQLGHVECVRLLLEGAPLEYREIADPRGNGLTALEASIDHIECMRLLLKDANPAFKERTQSNNAETCLHRAIAHGKLDVLKLLLKETSMAYKYQKTSEQMSPLHIAVAHEKYDIIKALLQGEPTEYREVTNEDGETPLESAASANDPKSVKILLNGISLNKPKVMRYVKSALGMSSGKSKVLISEFISEFQNAKKKKDLSAKVCNVCKFARNYP
eukprot:TRINITY_DN10047_c0_g1_i6.p1 TRINITY_DN10047_c0_g1~~TRINITY_DN10047_c0_g1_i6.p1  ORF type:complete len:536 (-),score=122.73 TRINITY_DN10047_c0_g1_i6:92-1549(-)